MNTRIILAGGTGFLGRVLADHFAAQGTPVVILTRQPKARTGSIREIAWNGATLGDWWKELEGARALINLAGVSVNCRYHARNRRLILDSRLCSTRVLGQAVARCAHPPPVWLNANTATIYKHTLGPAWDEAGELGGCAEAKDLFSVHVASEWERVLDESETPRTRKVALRSAWLLEIGAFFLRTETELIIKSRRVIPGKLLASGFTFEHPHLLGALQHLNSSH